jgi:PAS domain S-box-containing protein
VSPLLLIRAEEWMALVIAISGTSLGIWFARDNQSDLSAYRDEGWNGYASLAAVIGVRSGASKAILHALLAVLPIAGLSMTPPVGRYIVVITVYAALNVSQGVVIGAQVLNQRDRLRQRRRLLSSADTERPVVVAADPDTLAITAWTADAEELFGWTAAEAVGQGVAELLIPPSWLHQHRNGVARWRETGEAPALGQRMRVMAKTKSGAEVPVLMVITAERVGDRASLIGRFRRRNALE